MRFAKSAIAAACAAFLSIGSAAAETAEEPRCSGDMPSQILVPRGNQLSFALEADGVQIYACAAHGASFGWALQRPEAKLSEAGGVDAGTHYAGPTWEAKDGSKVVAVRVDGVTPDASAIPWLLLRAESHAGSGRMGEVTFVQRVRTSGGNAPASGCDASRAGAIARVPYAALYCFYRGERARP